MDADLISFESLLISKDAASATWWSMVFTAVAAVASLVTTVVAIYAARVAKKELSSWKEHEKQLQLVRLKRAVFAYRKALESLKNLNSDKQQLNDEFSNRMQPLLSDIYHELALSGMDYQDCFQAELFEKLAISHNLLRDGETKWSEVFKNAIDLQKSIKVEI